MAMTQSAVSAPHDRRLTALRHVPVLMLFTLLTGLAGTFSLGPLDRDEGRFIQATQQMLETGDYINIRFQESERNKKPVGIYWLQAASVSVLSDAEARDVWAYRIPSLIAAILSILLLYWAGCRLFDPQSAFIAALLLAAAPVFAGEATIAKTDSTLLTTVIAAQAALAAIFLRVFEDGGRARLATAALFWLAIGAGILIKGPITPMVSILTGLSLIVWQLLSGREGRRFTPPQWWQALRPLMGVFIVALVVAPWVIAIGITTEGRFFAEAVGTDMLGKVTDVQERHGGPFGYHFIALWVMFWPAALFLPMALRFAASRLTHPGVIFCLCWLVPSWIVFESASTKLAHYALPLYPALALLTGYMVKQLAGKAAHFPVSRLLGSIIYLSVAALACAALIYAPIRFGSGSADPLLTGLAGIMGIWSVVNVFTLWQGHLRSAFICSVLLSAMMIWTLFEYMLPRLDDLHVSPNISEKLKEYGRHPLLDDTGPVSLVGYHEPSAIFLLGAATRTDNPDSAARWIAAGKKRIVIIEDRQYDTFRNVLDTHAPDTILREFGVVTGHNYSNGVDVRLTFYISE